MAQFAGLPKDQIDEHRGVPRRLEGPEVAPTASRAAASGRTLPGVRVFLGVTGASGAPYAAGILDALAPREPRSGCAPRRPASRCSRPSSTATPALGATRCSTRFVGRRRRAGHRLRHRRLEEPRMPAARRRSTPTSSARARCRRSGRSRRGDVEPRPSRRLGRAQGAAQARARPARDAALVDPPARAGDAARGGCGDPLRGAGLLPRAETVGDLVDFVVARCLDQLGIDNTLVAAVGLVTHEAGTLDPAGVESMFDRIAPVYDVMNRVMTAGLDRRWRRLTVEAVVQPGDRVLDACCGTGDLALAAARRGAAAVVGPRLLGADARAGEAQVEQRSSGCAATCSPCRSATGRSTRRPSASASATSPISSAALRELRRVLRPGGRLAILEITQPRGLLRAVLLALVRPRRAAPRQGAARVARRTRTCPASVRRFPAPRSWPTCWRRAASRRSSSGSSAARSSRSTPGARRDHDRGHARDGQRAPRVCSAYLEAVEERLARTIESHPGSGRRGRRRRARRRRQAAAAGARLSSPRPRSAAAARGRCRRRARPSGDARPRRPDRRRAGPPRPRRGLDGARRRRRPRGRRLPLRARVLGARRRPATGPRSPSSPTRASRSRAARRCSAASATTPRRRSTRISSAARSRRGSCSRRRACSAAAAASTACCSGSRSRSPTTSSTAPATRSRRARSPGTDLRDGTPTLPLLLAAQVDPVVRARPRRRLARGRARPRRRERRSRALPGDGARLR